MAELLMTYCENGKPLGLKDRTLVHKDGDLHYGVQCWVVDGEQNVLLQLRHPKKEGSPNKWDVSCGGHLTDGEEPLSGVMREAKEELGLNINPNDLIFLSTFRYSSQEGRNQELLHIYLYFYNFNIKTLSYQKEEIASLKGISLQKLKKMYESNDPALANRQGALNALFKYFRPA